MEAGADTSSQGALGCAFTVIVRARDEADSIDRCLSLVAAQSQPREVIVVDSGSRDDTAARAAAAGATVLRMAPDEFTFGRALNLGAAAARGEILVALSAHAFVSDPRWLERIADWMADPLVACCSGDRFTAAGEPLLDAVRQDAAALDRAPRWGYSNAAGAFRRALWQERRFREDLPGCEDKEWAAHWLRRGRAAVIDPALVVEHDHTHDPVLSIYRRARREAEGFGAFVTPEPARPADLVRAWWSDLRFYDSALRARLSHRRAARLAGEWAGRRRARGASR